MRKTNARESSGRVDSGPRCFYTDQGRGRPRSSASTAGLGSLGDRAKMRLSGVPLPPHFWPVQLSTASELARQSIQCHFLKSMSRRFIASVCLYAGCLPILSAQSLVETLPPQIQPGPLHNVIERLFGQPVRDHRNEAGEALEAAAIAALRAINREGVTAGRVNEVGNAVEPFVIAALRSHGFAAGIPVTRSGRHQAAGYPDVAARRGGNAFYLEVKTYNPANEDTTQRSFYLSPSDDPKVTEPAFHLLIGFAMEPVGDGRYLARSVRLLDLFELPLNLKLEFNASNRDLYGPEPGLEIFSESP